MELSQIQLAGLELLGQLAGSRTKAVSSTPTTTYAHGNGGLFSFPGMDRQVFSAMMLPWGGLANRLPVKPYDGSFPYYGIITGVTDTTGSEPTGPCDDFPVSGLTKLCGQTRVFGRMGRMSRVFELDRAGLFNNRAEFMDYQVIGGPGGNQPFAPTIPGANGLGQAINNEVGKALFELAVTWQRDFAFDLYEGNPANNTSGGGRKYFRGLNLLINTGYRDAETGVACPAADSLIYSFNNANISTTNTGIVRTITNIYRQLKFNASQMNLSPVKWVIAMRRNAFYELTETWPCSYATYRCATVGGLSASQPGFVDGTRMQDMRLQMRGDMENMNGQYLLIDDEKVEVVLDEGIRESNPTAGSYASSLYFIPLTVVGGTPVTYFEYINYDLDGGAMAMARAMAPDGMFYTSDGGRFLWHRKPPTNYCVQLQAKMEPTLVFRTPFLSAKLSSVAYTPVQHERSSFPSDPYYTNGGKTDRLGYGPSFFSPTAAG